MPARRDTRREATRVRRLSPLQTVEDQSQAWGIRCHSCTWREGFAPSWNTELQGSYLPCGLPGSRSFLSTNGSHLDKRSVNRCAHYRGCQRGLERGLRTEYAPELHVDHAPFFPGLVHRGVPQPLGGHEVRLLGPARLAGRRRDHRLAIGVENRCLVGGVFIGDQQIHHPSACARVQVFDQRFRLLSSTLPRHNAHHQAMHGVEGDVIPVVTLGRVCRIIRIAVLLLFPYKSPFLGKLHLAGPRGKMRRAHRAGRGHVRLPADYTGAPYRGGRLAGDWSCARHSPQRRGPAPRSAWPSPASRQTAASLAALRSVPYSTGSRASANAAASRSAYRRTSCQLRACHGLGSLDCDSKIVRDRPPFPLPLQRHVRLHFSLCKNRPMQGSVQLLWDTIEYPKS